MSMTETPIPGQPEPEHMRRLREDAERARQADATVFERDRTIAFLKAGVDPDSDLGAAIVRRLGNGEVTAEAVTAARDAVEESLGLRQPPPPSPGQTPGTPEANFQQVQQALAGGGTPATILPPPAKTGDERAMDEFEAARKRGLPENEAREIGIAAMIISAQQGDQATVYDERAWFAERAEHGHGAEFAGLTDAQLIENPLPPNAVQQATSVGGRYAPR